MTQREQPSKKNEVLHYRHRFRLWYKRARSEGLPHGFLTKEFHTFLPLDRLGPMALRIYIYLLLWANDGGEAWREVPTMAENLGASIRHVQRGLAELKRKRLVASVKFSLKSRTRFFLLPYGNSAGEQQEEQV